MPTTVGKPSFEVPVVLVIFNRPDLTARVLAVLKDVRPARLFVIADGPRNAEESQLCAETRKLIDSVDWGCEVIKNFADENLGSGTRIATGLDWVFSQVEEAIILEDDCLPSNSFFVFCRELLSYYRNDARVMHIGGTNLFNLPWLERLPDDYPFSYFFSRIPTCWGWATWRRAWKYFDFCLGGWPEYSQSGYLGCALCDSNFREKWKTNLDGVYGGRQDIWDYQWVYACLSQNGLSIVPKYNLVSNYGFRADATHTKWENSPAACLETKEIEIIVHPPFIAANLEYVSRADRENEMKAPGLVKKILKLLRGHK